MWNAETGFMKFGVGTIFRLYHTPQIAGHDPPDIKPGDELRFVFADNTRAKANVVTTSADNLTFECNGTRYRATPRTSKDGPFPTPSVDWTHSTEWVIRA